MKTKKVIETNISELKGLHVLYFHNDENGWFINDEESIALSIKEYGKDFPKLLLSDLSKAFQFFAEQVVESIEPDLKDIWKRLDAIENLQAMTTAIDPRAKQKRYYKKNPGVLFAHGKIGCLIRRGKMKPAKGDHMLTEEPLDKHLASQECDCVEDCPGWYPDTEAVHGCYGDEKTCARICPVLEEIQIQCSCVCHFDTDGKHELD